jgi:hypothetical protein
MYSVVSCENGHTDHQSNDIVIMNPRENLRHVMLNGQMSEMIFVCATFVCHMELANVIK